MREPVRLPVALGDDETVPVTLSDTVTVLVMLGDAERLPVLLGDIETEADEESEGDAVSLLVCDADADSL